MAYFDCFDRESIIYISKNYHTYEFKNQEKITGKFYEIKANEEYYVKIKIYFFPSIIREYVKHVKPLNLNNSEIDMIDGDINYLYLKKDNKYELNFEKIKFKKMIKLSTKTLNSTIIITNNKKQIVLNKTSLYYKLEDNFHSKLLLEIKENNAFIEFLSQNDNNEILEDILLTSYLVKNKTTIIKIPFTQKDFILMLSSDKIFKYSLSLGLSTSKDYFYISNSSREISITNLVEDMYKEYYKLNTPFKDINLIENEFL